MRMRKPAAVLLAGAVVLAGACGGHSSSAPTTPTSPSATVNSITLSTTSTLQVAGTMQMKAEAAYSDGSKKDVTADAAWVSESTDLATIAPGGLMKGLAFGKVTIKATYQNVTGSLAVTVRGQLVSFTVTPVAFDCIGSCETFLEGPGEFAHRMDITATTGDSQTAHNVILSQTSGYPGAGGVILLNKGQSRSLNVPTSFEMRAEAGSYLDVEFRATEWDRVISAFREPRMSDLHKDNRYTWSTNGGWGSAFGAHSITLGSGSCEVRMRYVVEYSTVK